MNDHGANRIAKFIWGIAKEALRDVYVRHNYRHVTYVVENEVAT